MEQPTQNTTVIPIGLIDDQLLFRKGLKSILESWPELQVVYEAGEGYTVLDNLAQQTIMPEVMLVDLSLPPNGDQEFSGLDVTLALQQAYPEMKVLILSVHDDPYYIAQLIEQGARAYMVKDCDPEELHEAIVAVHEHGSYINERTLKAIRDRLKSGKSTRQPVNTPLTKREEEIIKLICMQLTAEEIGERLFISPKTVNGHRNNLLQKTGSRNVTGLVIYAIKHQLVSVL